MDLLAARVRGTLDLPPAVRLTGYLSRLEIVMFTTRTAQLRHRHGGSPEVLYAIEYTHLPADRASRWDWGSTPEARDDIMAAARRLADNGDTFATYNRPAEEVWELIYDDLPADADAALLAPELARLQSEVERLNRLLESAREPIEDVHDERLAPIWEKAAETATAEGFCSEYDRLTARLGIPGRDRLYRGIVNVSFNVYAYAEARDPEVARQDMESAVREALRGIRTNDDYGQHSAGSITHVDIDSLEADDVNIYD